jgi:hypothetical protein
MDINQQLQPVVESLINNLKTSIEVELQNKISEEVIRKIASTELNTVVESLVTQQLTDRITKFNFEATTKQQLDKLVGQLTAQINKGLATAANEKIAIEINKQIAATDINAIINNQTANRISAMISGGSFPSQSIPHTSINFKNFALTGDNVKGGIIENFGSAGIEDRATHVQMTLMDHATAFEGPLWAPEIKVKGKLVVDGDLLINGDIAVTSAGFTKLVDYSAQQVKENLNATLFQSYSDLIHKNLLEGGIDLDRITQGGKEIIKGNQLGYHIVDTNIQRLGIVKDFQSSGENLLSNTLYITNKRVGVNTIEPSSALTVWDEECEIITGKRKQDTGYIGTIRNQKLIVGSNNKENIVLSTDGTVQIAKLTINNVQISSAPMTPNSDGMYGQLILNENPSPGAFIGWVCLGGSRWAGFGKIE